MKLHYKKKKSAETSQILNVPATTPKAKASQTSTNSISDNSEKINTKNEKFQLSDTVEETKDLVAVHNLSESKLMKALELGGMPMPSIVVIQLKQSGSRVTVIGEVYVNGNEPVLAVLELAPSKNNILINQVKIASAYKKTMPKTLSIRVKSYILIVTKKSCSMVTVYWAPIAGQLAKLQL